MPRRVTVTANINGQAFAVIEGSSLYEEPDLTDPIAKEACEALRFADVGVRGRGKTYEITCSPEAATMIMDYCRKTGELFKSGADLATRRDGDALLLAADRIYYKLREVNGDAPWQAPDES